MEFEWDPAKAGRSAVSMRWCCSSHTRCAARRAAS